MTQAEYNAKIQEIQEMWSEASRIQPYRKGGDAEILYACFEVYWDGNWHELGRQWKPLTPEATYEWNEDREMRLRGKFAGALSHS